MNRIETLACGTLNASDMYPTKSQRITAILGARYSRFFSGTLMAATCAFAVHTSVCAAELEGQGTENIPPLPEVSPATLGTDTPLLAQADTAPKKKGAKRPKVNVDEKGVILKGYDAVAYFKQGKAVKGDPKYSSTYGGATYYFASASDKQEFDKSPAKYKPQYGGYCADAMKKGLFHDIDPNQFFVYKGKLYVCTGTEQIKDFESAPDSNIKKADKKWQYYQPHEIPDYLGGG
jgi:YHS domain-containing protein